jgi:hypothetical protein
MAALRVLSAKDVRKDTPMLDVLMLVLGLGLFGLMATYAAGCGKI